MSYTYQIKSLEQYHRAYRRSVEQPEEFWSDIADNFHWRKKWDKVLEWNFTEPNIKWFINGKLNITDNCLDRHLKDGADVPAIIWEPNDPSEASRTLTYNELHSHVCMFGQVLKNNEVKRGDRVCIYMGMIPELAIAVLACARIGAIHSVIFGGFSAQSIADRLQDAKAEFIITCDGAFRGPKDIPLKSVIDDALIVCPFVKRVIVYNRTHTSVSMIKDRDVWWGEEMDKVASSISPNGEEPNPQPMLLQDAAINKNISISEVGAADSSPVGGSLGWLGGAEEMDSEDILFILYTSGSTGKPKGVVHTCGGYMVYTAYSFVNVFQYQPGDIHFCTADIGWITGHSYILYGPLIAGATSLMFEGIPTWPDAGRFWDIVQKHKVNILYTAPTAIRSLMGFGTEPVAGKDLSSLKVLGTVGEPINEEAWHWYDKNIGNKKCPIVDTWWQTETGGILISTLAGVTPAKPTYATLPLPGIQPVLIDEAPSNSPNGGEQSQLLEKSEFYENADTILYGVLKDFVSTHRKNPTQAEEFLWQQLRGKKLENYKFRRQHIIESYIADFVCLSKKLIIEVDGLIHQLPENITSDHERPGWLNEKGYEVIRFSNEEILNNIETVIKKIAEKLDELPFAEKKNYSRDFPPLGEQKGALCIRFPWPSILRTTYGDHERCRQNYFSTYPNLYFTGDGALRDEEGNYRITGRVDDVLNVSGHRIGTAEVENAINMHTGVVESAVVGYPHHIKGQGIYAYVIFNGNVEDETLIKQDILQTVTRIIGAIAKPDKIQLVKGLPKTRSGKIMRRILRKIAEGETENFGDTTTLLDPAVVEEIAGGKL
ncbi:MAG: AMP-binding protein [Chitinophagaceae bacterium]